MMIMIDAVTTDDDATDAANRPRVLPGVVFVRTPNGNNAVLDNLSFHPITRLFNPPESNRGTASGTRDAGRPAGDLNLSEIQN